MAYIVQFADGKKVRFDQMPTPDEIEEVANAHGIKAAPTGFSEEVGQAVSRGAGRLEKAADLMAERKSGSSVLQTVGAAAGVLSDLAGSVWKRIPAQIKYGQYYGVTQNAPEPVQKAAEGTKDAILRSSLGQEGMKALQGGLESWEAFKASNPEAAANIESVVDIASIIPATRLSGATTRQALKTAGRVAGETVESAGKYAAGRRSAKVTRDLMPVETAERFDEAVRQGRTKKTGLLRTEKIVKPSNETIEVAEEVEGLFKPGWSDQKKVTELTKEVARYSENVVEPALAANKTGFSEKQLFGKTGRLSRLIEERPVGFKGAKANANAYADVIAEARKAVSKYPKNAAGLWKARKDFDRMVSKRFPQRVWSDPDSNAVYNAIANVRREMNNMIGDLGDNDFKAHMRHLNAIYDAVDVFAEKGVAGRGKNILQRHPTAAKVAGAAGTYLLGKEILD